MSRTPNAGRASRADKRVHEEVKTDETNWRLIASGRRGVVAVTALARSANSAYAAVGRIFERAGLAIAGFSKWGARRLRSDFF